MVLVSIHVGATFCAHHVLLITIRNILVVPDMNIKGISGAVCIIASITPRNQISACFTFVVVVDVHIMGTSAFIITRSLNPVILRSTGAALVHCGVKYSHLIITPITFP